MGRAENFMLHIHLILHDAFGITYAFHIARARHIACTFIP
jgi:hypothetical protein